MPEQSNSETDTVETLLKTLKSTSPNIRSSDRLEEIIASLENAGDRRAVAPLNELISNIDNLVRGARREGAPEGVLALMESLSAKARKAIATIEESGQAVQLQETPKTSPGLKMNFLRNLFARKPTTKTQTIQRPPTPLSEEEYVHRCLEAEFVEEQETRTFRSDPAFATVLSPLNSKQYAQAIQAGQALVPRFPDFDLIYKWLGSAYRSTQQLPRSRDILSEGLAKAKRKSLLLTDMGETEWQSGNINEAVYWWSQALHCLSSNPIDYSAYLLLSYVANGLGIADFERLLLARVDSLSSGQIRLDRTTANRLTMLVQNQKNDSMRQVLEALQSRYFSPP